MTRTFDITPDGKQIVFDRTQENASVVLINLPVWIPGQSEQHSGRGRTDFWWNQPGSDGLRQNRSNK
jgi:hypothetical protein